MSNKEKNFIGGFIRKRDFDNGGHIINCSLDINDLMKLPRTGPKKNLVKINICSKQQPDERYGTTHYAVEDTFVPNPNHSSYPSQGAGPKEVQDPGYGNGGIESDDINIEDIPF